MVQSVSLKLVLNFSNYGSRCSFRPLCKRGQLRVFCEAGDLAALKNPPPRKKHASTPFFKGGEKLQAKSLFGFGTLAEIFFHQRNFGK